MIPLESECLESNRIFAYFYQLHAVILLLAFREYFIRAETISRSGGIHGNPGSGNHPQRQPLTGTVTLNESVDTTYLTHTYLDINHQRGGGGREQESAKIH